jgi:hypothetical protein
MVDPRDDVVIELALNSAWIRPFSGFIFICGGPVDVREQEPPSVRDALLRLASGTPGLANRIRLAEEFKEWAVDGHYKDLLTFEEHLAEFSDLIVLILESPGTLTELGLFSAMEAFREKLSVYISSVHFAQPSFIRLGPVKYLELASNKAEVFPWTREEAGRDVVDREWLRQSGNELLESLEERLQEARPETRFDSKRWLHKALLICNLVEMMSALTITEIASYIEIFDVDLSNDELRQALFILEKLDLISIVARSRQRFYVSKNKSDYIRWSVRPAELDLARFRMEVVRYYEVSDKKRFRALQESRI